MKSKSFLLLAFVMGFIISCEKENESNTFSFAGKAQKGPFVTGTSVTINELNNRLGQTGKTFSSTIISDDGIFELNDIELSSNMALLTANGYYFEELYGKLSPAILSLQSISDLSEKETFNINILTHIIKARIESLVSEGLAYHEAKKQAESEFLDFLGVHESYDHNFDDLDISQNEESNAMLLAFSVIVQRYTNAEFERPSLTAELTQLLTHLGTDFKDNGQINDPSLIDTLLYNISQLNLIDIRNNIERRYSELGLTTLIPEFEDYIGNFQVAHKDEIYTTFIYPEKAYPSLFQNSPEVQIPNILAKEDINVQRGPYSFAAITPLDASLRIKFISDNNNYSYVISAPEGWEFINEYPNGFIVNSQRRNELMTMLLFLENPGTATIEYYENGTEVPTYTKMISWEQQENP